MNSTVSSRFPVRPAFIGQDRVVGSDRLVVRNPATAEVLAEVTRVGRAEIEQAIAAGSAAFASTRALPAYRRAEILDAVWRGVNARREELVSTIVAEAGKPVRYARGEVQRCLVTLRLAAEEATRIPGEMLPADIEARGAGAWCLVRRFPAGLLAALTPFNFPLNLVAHKVAPAIAAGNPVILKPSPRTPLTALILAEIVRSTDWPAGAFSCVVCDNDSAEPLWQDERVRVVSFTGSDAVGWKIKEQAPRKKVILELGGNAGAIVHQDADLDAAAEKLAAAAFGYAGQVCIKAQRLYVHQPIYEAFVGKLVERTRRIEPGDPASPETILGPMIDQESALRVASWIAEAVGGGARVLCGDRREGARLWPTLLANVPPEAKVARREIFGPVAIVEPYGDFGEAVSRVNDSRYGLQAAVFTRDIGRIQAAFAELEVGGVIVNDAPWIRLDHFPYGGIKDSGFGREGVRYAIEEMTEPRVALIHS